MPGLMQAQMDALGITAARRKREEEAKAREAQRAGRFAVPGAERIQEGLGQQAEIARGQQTGPVPVGQLAADSSFRGDQSALVSALQARAAGRGPSLAQMSIERGRDAALASQTSAAAGVRPDMAGLAGLAAAKNRGRIGMEATSQIAQAREGERQAAESMLAQVLSGARGQDLGLSQFNAQQALQRMGMGNELAMAGMGQDINLAGMQQQGGIQLEQLLAAEAARRAAEPKWWQRALGAATGGLQAIKLSDERLKTDIAPITGALDLLEEIG